MGNQAWLLFLFQLLMRGMHYKYNNNAFHKLFKSYYNPIIGYKNISALGYESYDHHTYNFITHDDFL
jgi:hypothetical protein